MIRSLSVLVAISLILIVASSSIVAADTSKMDAVLREVVGRDDGPATEVAVIVQGPQADTDGFVALGGSVRCSFTSIDGFAGTIPSDRLEQLASLPGVERLSADAGVRKMLDTVAPAVGAPFAWRNLGLTGRGVAVAVIDSGVTDHPDYAALHLVGPDGTCPSRIIGGYDFITDNPDFLDNDHCGHGSSIVGIMAGNGGSSTNTDPDHPLYFRTFTGIAPEVSVVNCRVLDNQGVGLVSSVIEAIDWCIAHAAEYNIRVINLSLGHPVTESWRTDPLSQACEQAWLSGLFVVVSAGNLGEYGYSTVFSPGNHPLVLTVGAATTNGTPGRDDDDLCYYSSRGPSAIDHVVKPDIVAPGNQVIATRHPNSLLERYWSWSNLLPPDEYKLDPETNIKKTGYFVLSGTSMAAGVVSGAAALMIQHDLSLSPDTIKSRLMLTAQRSLAYDPVEEGSGYIDLVSALECIVTSATLAVSPTVLIDDAGQPTINGPILDVEGENLVWEPAPPPPSSATDDGGAGYPGVGGGNLVWEPTPMPPADAYVGEPQLFEEVIYDDGPGDWNYDPALDSMWDGGEGTEIQTLVYASMAGVAIHGDAKRPGTSSIKVRPWARHAR